MQFVSEEEDVGYIMVTWCFFYLDFEHLENPNLSFWMSELDRWLFVKINIFL